jgi:hypothetical protein
MKDEVLKSLARLMQQTAVKQAVQERALRRLLALVPAERTAAFADGLRADVDEVMNDFSAGIDQPTVTATILFELNAMLDVLKEGKSSADAS